MISDRDLIIDRDVNGIWLYIGEPSPEDHLGMLLHQLGDKGTPNLVRLKVKFYKKYLFQPENKKENQYIAMSCSIGAWRRIHSAPVAVLTRTIPPRNIELDGVYDLVRMVS